ncbi:DUF6867 family protein [Pararhizobium sp.]|uniref:DUF6867 family protein n=1 Tax=Pararhizobium sp. TaxID=1977563 RepID=UPI0027229D50|nr:hypothetical protein [Pararhizobium sp.]MDO9415028.1 hypothetical protein [Pararhizobium sp.]
MHGILYEEANILQFLFVTCIIGGWTAWRTGRSCAESWQNYATVVVSTLILGAGIRFVHFAIFEGTLLSLQYYAVDTIILLVFSTAGYRYKRTLQMTNNYYWLYEKVSPFSWKKK